MAKRGTVYLIGDGLRSVGGPAEGIDDYEDARPVIESYLGHLASSATSALPPPAL
jgi:hypothetical protein